MHETVRVAVDTNVLVSALVGHGNPRRLLAELLESHEVISSREMLAELVEVLSREKFKEIRKNELDSFLSILGRKIVLVALLQPLDIIYEDPDDNIVLSAAVEGKAEYLVTGDKHLLNLKSFRGLRIISVSEMVLTLESDRKKNYQKSERAESHSFRQALL